MAGVLICLVVGFAWLSDDALITLRMLLNADAGYGLTWNTGERVLAFTHPLWALSVYLGFQVTGALFATLFALSVLFAAAAIVGLLVAWRSYGTPSPMPAVLALSCLILSKAFLDHAASGLETPLSYALYGGVFLVALSEDRWADARFFWLCVLSGLMVLNRMDLGLLVLPLLLLSLRESGSRLRRFLIGCAAFLPVVAWLVFSLVYFGAPFPNTFYAKIGAGIPRTELLAVAGHYFYLQIRDDLPSVIVLAMMVVCYRLTPHPPVRAMIVGVILYLLYIVWIGGDFMQGRYFAVPVYAAAMVIATTPLSSRMARGVMLAVVVTATLGASPVAGLRVLVFDREHSITNAASGIVDERRYYRRQEQGFLLMLLRGRTPKMHTDWTTRPGQPAPVYVTCGGLGAYGLQFGPQVSFIDQCALNDAFVSRLPALYPAPEYSPGGVADHFSTRGWRIGHLTRGFPAAYLAFMQAYRQEFSGNAGVPPADGIGRSLKNIGRTTLVDDPATSALFVDVRRVIAGPVWSRERFAAIWRLNTGAYGTIARETLTTSQQLLSRPNAVDLFAKSTFPARSVAGQLTDASVPETPDGSSARDGLKIAGPVVVRLRAPVTTDCVTVPLAGNDVYYVRISGGDGEAATLTGGISDPLMRDRKVLLGRPMEVRAIDVHPVIGYTLFTIGRPRPVCDD